MTMTAATAASWRGKPLAARPRLAILVSHPIQYFSPLYRALAASGAVDLKVFYCSRIGLDSFRDPGLGVELAWKTDLLGGFASQFLPSAPHVTSLDWASFDNRDAAGALSAFAPDALIIHGYARKTLLRALVWAKWHGVPAMLVADSTTDTSPARGVRRIKQMILPLLLRRYGAILTMSERGEAHFRSYGMPAARMFRVPTMMDSRFWEARDSRAAQSARIRQQLGIASNETVLLAVGKIYPTKRIGDIVEALARLHRPDLRLLMVGDGTDRQTLEQKAKDLGVRATFTGFVNIDALPAYYAAGDFLVHPAELEQFGMVAIEAAIVGLPMILSDRVGAVGATSIAQPGRNTIVYPCGDIGSLAAAIADLADNPGKRSQMAAQSLRISREHDGTTSVANVLRALAMCLRSPPTLNTALPQERPR